MSEFLRFFRYFEIIIHKCLILGPSPPLNDAELMDDLSLTPRLATELWLEIFSHLKTTTRNFVLIADLSPHVPTFRRLLLVSRQFRGLAESKLYEWLFLRRQSKRTMTLVDCLKASPQKLAFVKYLVVDGGSDESKVFNADIADVLKEANCRRFVSLKAVHFRNCRLLVQVISAIIRLPPLRIWESEVRLTGDPKAILFDPERLNLTHLMIRVDEGGSQSPGDYAGEV